MTKGTEEVWILSSY